jgi:hypothetical protein
MEEVLFSSEEDDEAEDEKGDEDVDEDEESEAEHRLARLVRKKVACRTQMTSKTHDLSKAMRSDSWMFMK